MVRAEKSGTNATLVPKHGFVVDAVDDGSNQGTTCLHAVAGGMRTRASSAETSEGAVDG